MDKRISQLNSKFRAKHKLTLIWLYTLPVHGLGQLIAINIIFAPGAAGTNVNKTKCRLQVVLSASTLPRSN